MILLLAIYKIEPCQDSTNCYKRVHPLLNLKKISDNEIKVIMTKVGFIGAGDIAYFMAKVQQAEGAELGNLEPHLSKAEEKATV